MLRGLRRRFFDDPSNGIHWALAHTPRIPSPFACLRWVGALTDSTERHPEWKSSPIAERMRKPRGR
jgi:hypothetical protein